MAEITYIGKRTVISAKPVQPEKFYPLSVLDRLMEQNHLKMVYYFQTPIGRETGEITKKLSKSLSEMLTYFPIVTGRLLKDQEEHWMINCNDAGVRMVEARAKGSVDEWLQNRENELKLVHWEAMGHEPYFWSTFNVQLTEFEEGGLAIGLSCFHVLADLTCATMFIKAWADTNLTGKMIHPPFFHPLPPRRPGNKNPNHQFYTQLINYYKSTIEKSNLVTATGTEYATIALAFTDPMVQACMAMARTTSTPNQPSPSPFMALSGLFWTCISKIKGKVDGLIDMGICLDMRNVLGLDKGFFGNCIVYNKVQTEPLKDHELSSATWAIGEVMSKMDNEGIMDLIEWLESNDDQSLTLMNGCDLICANLEGVDPYFTSFEEGFAPVRVSYYVEPAAGEGHVLVLPAPPGESEGVGGAMSRVVMVTLPKDEVVRLCEDDLILSFSPTILMGINK